jgi:hypothetical protein
MGRPRKYTEEERKEKLIEYQRRYYERNRDRLLEVAHRNYVKSTEGAVSRRNRTEMNTRDHSLKQTKLCFVEQTKQNVEQMTSDAQPTNEKFHRVDYNSG